MLPKLGLIEPPAPDVHADVAPHVAPDLAPDLAPGAAAELYLGPEIYPGLPAFRSVVLSVLFHGLVIAALTTIRFPVAMPPPQPAEALSPTEIRIGQHVYYVARITPPETPKPETKQTKDPPRKTTAAPALALRN